MPSFESVRTTERGLNMIDVVMLLVVIVFLGVMLDAVAVEKGVRVAGIRWNEVPMEAGRFAKDLVSWVIGRATPVESRAAEPPRSSR